MSSADVALYQSVQSVYSRGDRAAVLDHARSFLPRKMDDPVHYGLAFEMMIYCLATTRRESPQKIIEEVKRIADAEMTLNGESYWLHSALGCIALHSDKTDKQAYLQFALGSAKLRGFENIYHISSGMDAIRPLDFDPSRLAAQINGHYQVLHAPKMDAKFIHLVSADPVYFYRYARRLLDNTRAYCRDEHVAVHCHISCPDDEALDLAAKLHAEYPSFGASFDTLTMPEHLSSHSRKAYFASARFLFAADVLALYDVGVVVTDIDIEVTNSYAEVMEAATNNPAAFSCGVSSLAHYYPWLRVGAQLSTFQSSPAGLTVAKHLGDYIRSTFDVNRGAHNWLIDQTALWHTYENFNSIGRTRLFALGKGKK